MPSRNRATVPTGWWATLQRTIVVAMAQNESNNTRRPAGEDLVSGEVARRFEAAISEATRLFQVSRSAAKKITGKFLEQAGRRLARTATLLRGVCRAALDEAMRRTQGLPQPAAALSSRLLEHFETTASALAVIGALEGLLFLMPGLVERSSLSVLGGSVSCLMAVLALLWIAVGLRRLESVILVAAVVSFATFAIHISTASNFPARPLQVSIAIFWLVFVAFSLVRALNVVRFKLLTRLAGGFAALLLLGEMALLEASPLNRLVPRYPLVSDGPSAFSDGTVQHRIGGGHHSALSLARSNYWDDPRGYFLRADDSRETWKLYVHEQASAKLEFPGDPNHVRVSIGHSGGYRDWHVIANYSSFEIEADTDYSLSFDGRSDRYRPFTAGLFRNEPPGDYLGLFEENTLRTEWETYTVEFTSTGETGNARLSFFIGGSDSSGEFRNVRLTRRDTGEIVEPRIVPWYFVEYEFDELGCRSRADGSPHGQDTSRILMLGDSATLGVGVHEHDVVSSVLERNLNALPNRHVEVINCGIAGAAMRDIRRFYEQLGARYEPDVVVLTLSSREQRSWGQNVEQGYVRIARRFETLSYTLAFLASLLPPPDPPSYSALLEELRILRQSLDGHGVPLIVGLVGDSGYEPYALLREAVLNRLEGPEVAIFEWDDGFTNGSSYADSAVHADDPHPNESVHASAARVLEELLSDGGYLSR